MLDFKLIQPNSALGELVQGIWAAKVSADSAQSISSNLPCDGGTGVLFNLAGPIHLAGVCLNKGVALLAVKKRAQQIILPPGASLAGFRFHPAIGAGLFSLQGESAVRCDPSQTQALNTLHHQLSAADSLQVQVDMIRTWLMLTITDNPVPSALRLAMKQIDVRAKSASLNVYNQSEQRQLQRLFKRWLGLSPKYYQRIARFKVALVQLRTVEHIDLAHIALDLGFTDQAHMTREFQQLAGVTPGSFIRRHRERH